MNFATIKFSTGVLLATPGALKALEKAGQTAEFFLSRHELGDWGEVCDEDQRLNDLALITGERLLSAYRTLRNQRIWVLTDAADDDGQREATTVLLPEEY